MKTFTLASADRELVQAQLAKNIENACIKARRYKLAAQRVLVFLRTQDFRDVGREVELSRPTCFPNDILRAIAPAFEALSVAGTRYRATGVILHHFSEAYYGQLDLFGEVVRMQRLSHLYESVDALSAKYGKYTLFLAASLPAHLHAQHPATGASSRSGTSPCSQARHAASAWASPVSGGGPLAIGACWNRTRVGKAPSASRWTQKATTWGRRLVGRRAKTGHQYATH